MTDRPSLTDLAAGVPFSRRHIGPSDADEQRMLDAIGQPTVDALLEAAVPAVIRANERLALPEAATEPEAIAELRAVAALNRPMTQMIGLGYHDTHTPPVVLRNVLENPAWYTAYTPYQPEISQGRLEALLNFQTVVADLTGLPVSNASLLDEGSAAAEAMALARRGSKSKSDVFVVDADVHPQTLAVLQTRAEPLGIALHVTELTEELPACFGVLVQYPGSSGAVRDHAAVVTAAHEQGALVAVAADLLALTLLRPPGEAGADIAVGCAQRFGVPLGFGGPHAGYMAVRESLQRMLPGRLVGVSVDADGQPAYRLALQTREQHIRRERATSNICTAQVLLAVMASMYAVWHGPDGLRLIAQRAHRMATVLAAGLRGGDVEIVHEAFFDTVQARVPGRAAAVVDAAAEAGVNLRLVDADTVAIACDEVTTVADLQLIWAAFGVTVGDVAGLDTASGDTLPESALADQRVPHPPGLPQPPLGDVDAALPAQAGRLRRGAGPGHDPARLLHDEAQRDHRDGADHLAGVRQDPPVRAGRAGPRVRVDHRGPGGLAGRGDRVRRGEPAAQRRFPGRVRRAAGDPGLAPRPR